ncbi:hypothetical protein CCACVL1_18087 [Corchorus capsularis]|uniref:Glyoxalase At5g48480-like C-terminal domain-containing protein n=1 Tax=Corchorus capsularis TaxID=210143 RepID=A0A1R3HN80_COCAP|nr:hypothetical protein CCACVL1_18087 [Corchorus capsularis]
METEDVEAAVAKAVSAGAVAEEEIVGTEETDGLFLGPKTDPRRLGTDVGSLGS